MASLTSHSSIVVQPTYSCFFEQAEHLLESLFHHKWHVSEPRIRQEVATYQQTFTAPSAEILQVMVQSKALKKQVRVGMLLHSELLDAMDRLSVEICRSPESQKM